MIKTSNLVDVKTFLQYQLKKTIVDLNETRFLKGSFKEDHSDDGKTRTY